jgi:hypothetical protein
VNEWSVASPSSVRAFDFLFGFEFQSGLVVVLNGLQAAGRGLQFVAADSIAPLVPGSV